MFILLTLIGLNLNYKTVNLNVYKNKASTDIKALQNAHVNIYI